MLRADDCLKGTFWLFNFIFTVNKEKSLVALEISYVQKPISQGMTAYPFSHCAFLLTCIFPAVLSVRMLFFNGTLRTDRPQLFCAAICSELFVCLTWLHAVDDWS